MNSALLVLIIGVGLVVIYDFTNGFHDAADMIATAIASRSMMPVTAIVIVTIFTFLGPFIGGLAVADTIGQFVNIKGVQVAIAQAIVFSAVLAAITYNLITWYLGLPTSSSNSLTSGLVGAGLWTLGSSHIHWGMEALTEGHFEGFIKIITGMFFSPLAGFIVGFLLIKFFLKIFKHLSTDTLPFFKFSQYLSVSWLAFSHGVNDAQKGMGLITMLLLASGKIHSFMVQDWTILLCASAITSGTLFGGWNIIKTVGYDIYRVKIIHSLADQIGSAMVILGSAFVGAPTSTTQVVTTTLTGVGAGEHPHRVHWIKVKQIIAGWMFNIPISMLLGAIYSYLLLKLL